MKKTIIRYRFLLLAMLLMVSALLPLKAERTANGTILIVTSYNPDTRSIADNLSAFMDEYKRRGGKHLITVENMNCKNLSEAHEWKPRMARILKKYEDTSAPSLVILLGQEAWTSFISQDSEIARKTPAVCGMVSTNTILLPEEAVDLNKWMPESKNIFADFPDYNIVGGCAYHYNIDKNIELMRRFYPKMKEVAFVSDNTYGGLCMQALVKKEMKKYPELKLTLIDGRVNSFMEVSEKMRRLPKTGEVCVLIGTWRIDRTENYVIGNTTYMLREANPGLPVFSVATVGLGHWALGGYTPAYRRVGGKIADDVVKYLNGDRQDISLESIGGNYVFDVKRLHEFGLDSIDLPEGAELVNQPPSFYEEHKSWVIGVAAAFIFLLACFLIAVYYIVRINRLKDNLEKTSEELLEAKQKAEEASRLKTAFLANMSHEIRTPLNAIVGFSSILVNDDVEKEEKEQYGDIIRKNSDLLLHLINDILDVSRMESGHIKFDMEECEVVELCRMALSTAECARRSNATYRFETNITSLKITTDVQRLKQVLINLLSNAGKFTPTGFICLSIRVDREHNRLEFAVTDTGCGIPADKIEKVFERFEKLDEHSQGTGLGLSICKLIVEKLGGKIWVDEEYKEGARFVFTHPLN